LSFFKVYFSAVLLYFKILSYFSSCCYLVVLIYFLFYSQVFLSLALPHILFLSSSFSVPWLNLASSFLIFLPPPLFHSFIINNSTFTNF
jgi:hypothetical protein